MRAVLADDGSTMMMMSLFFVLNVESVEKMDGGVFVLCCGGTKVERSGEGKFQMERRTPIYSRAKRPNHLFGDFPDSVI